MLPLYLLEADGTAISKETGEVIDPINRTEYRLETAENVFLEIRNKTINLVRRFTREQLIKLYKEGEDVNEVSEKPEKTKAQTRSIGSKRTFAKNDKAVYSINDVEYLSLRQASELLGMSKDVISKRLSSADYPTYYKIE